MQKFRRTNTETEIRSQTTEVSAICLSPEAQDVFCVDYRGQER